MRPKHFQLVAFFVSLCLTVVCEAVDRPDLVPKRLFLDSQNRLNVTYKNEGAGEVPAGRGAFEVYVNGRLMARHRFDDLPEHFYPQPGRDVTFCTKIRMDQRAGLYRRVAIALDPNHEIEEHNELQNTLCRTLRPAALEGPDFVITDFFFEDDNKLVYTLSNIGNRGSPKDLVADMKVFVDDNEVAKLCQVLRYIPAGSSYQRPLHLPTTIPTICRVRLILTPRALLSEIDNTNNFQERVRPRDSILIPYAQLLTLPKIVDSIKWASPWSVRSYRNWSEAEKQDLHNTIIALEEGRPISPSGPPDLFMGYYIRGEDAWRIYLNHVAQTLWTEVHGLVPWHLTDFSDRELKYLLDSRTLLLVSGVFPFSNPERALMSGEKACYPRTQRDFLARFSEDLMGRVTAWNPRICYDFLANFNLIKESQVDTIHALTDWMRAHLIHAGQGDNFLDIFDYEGLPPVDKMLYPLEGRRHVTDGCWGTSGFYAAVLRSINIPVEHGRMKLLGGTHSRPIFLSVGQSFPHADDVYTGTLRPSGAYVPVHRIFYTLDQMETKFLHPQVDCSDGHCNSSAEQTSYNHYKDHIQLAYDFFGDGLLCNYARYGRAYLDDSLKGPFVAGEVYHFVRPCFISSVRKRMIDNIEAVVRLNGGGDLGLGKRRVIQRCERWQENR